MEYRIQVEYDGGLNGETDAAIKAVAGDSLGSGCCLFEPYTRDMMFVRGSADEAAALTGWLKDIEGVRARVAWDGEDEALANAD